MKIDYINRLYFTHTHTHTHNTRARTSFCDYRY